jgi:prophage regulatory protein
MREQQPAGARSMNTASPIIRVGPAAARAGMSVRVLYERQSVGLMPSAFAVGPRQRAFFEHEIDAVNAARAAGMGDDELRRLVLSIEAARKNKLQALRGLIVEV